MNKKDLKKFLIENESHTIENTEEKLLSFVKGTMLNRNDVIDQDDQSHHRQEERLRNQLGFVAQVEKSRYDPYPRRSYATAGTATVVGHPSCVNRLSKATRTCNSVT